MVSMLLPDSSVLLASWPVGHGDVAWQIQDNAHYGIVFEKMEEAAFANYHLWEALGFIIALGSL